MMHGQKNIKLY